MLDGDPARFRRDRFARDAELGARRCQDRHIWGSVEYLRNQIRFLTDMFEIVEHQELSLSCQVGQELCLEIVITRQTKAESLHHRLSDVTSGVDVSEGNEEHTNGKVVRELSGRLDRKPCLTQTTSRPLRGPSPQHRCAPTRQR